ncbi:MAG: cytochrome d ubiquinol oxidase subunit II [Thermoleophilia bacterium]
MSDLVTAANAAAALLGAALVFYAVFAGADFGVGVWIAESRLRGRGGHQLSLLRAMGPVWETNHIWLIVVIVTLFTAFPSAFAALFIALLVPLVLLLLGITVRGAAFAYWHYGESLPRRLPATVETLAVASLLTPFFMGMAVTSPAAGTIRLVQGEVVTGAWESWTSGFTLMGGLTALGICAYLTPIYMTVRTAGETREGFRRRGIAGALTLGVLTTATLPVAWRSAPDFFAELTSPVPLAFVAAAVILGITALGDLWIKQYRAAQLTAAATVTTTIGGFLAALYPDLILGQMSIQEAAAPRSTLIAYLVTLALGSLILVPSLAYLYYTYRGNPDPELPPNPTNHESGDEPPATEEPESDESR